MRPVSHALGVRLVGLAVVALIASACAAAQAQKPRGTSGYADKFGGPVPGLSPTQLAQFERGKAKFSRLFTPQTGLGPLFNDNSCRVCHGIGASGGHSERTVRLAGAMLNGGPSLLEHVGGPMIQDHAVAGTPIEQVPAISTALANRISPNVWGLGLVEAVPESQLLSQMAPDEAKFALGVRGIANWDSGKIGRFGMKAQKPDLKIFTEQAFDWELGISTPDRRLEQVPNGQARKVKASDISQDELMDVVFYQRYLGAPPRAEEVTQEAKRGQKHFTEAGCVHCHNPSLVTGPNTIGIPEGIEVVAYSDFLLHVMDEALADQMVQGASTGQMWRTQPLWGIRLRSKFMHDGRATTLDDAIAMHGGEAGKVKDRYLALKDEEKKAVTAFIQTL